MEALPATLQEAAARLRLEEHDCDGCGDTESPVVPVRSVNNPLFLRFLCTEKCSKDGSVERLFEEI